MKPFAALLASALVATLPLAGQTPVDPKSPIPGYPDGRGPKGPVVVKILTPTPGEVIPIPAAAPGQPAPKGARVEVKVTVENFETWKDAATGRGQHVQLVLDGRALPAWYEIDKPWLFPALPAGTHTLLAVVQRPWLETIHEPGALAAVTFHVGAKSDRPVFDPSKPTITVNAPRGKFKGAETAKILFDFFVTGCRIGPATDPEACQVVYRLDQEPQKVLTIWEPIYLENLPAGRHGYVAALYRGEKRIDAPFTLAQGFFEVEPPAAPGSAPAATPVAPGGGAPQPSPAGAAPAVAAPAPPKAG